MTTPEERITELGLTLPEVAAPVASYAPTVRSGDHVYVSGQLPLVKGELAAKGKVGAEVTPETAQELAAVCALNAIAAVRAASGERTSAPTPTPAPAANTASSGTVHSRRSPTGSVHDTVPYTVGATAGSADNTPIRGSAALTAPSPP